MSRISFVNILKLEDDIKEKIRCWRNSEDVSKYMLSQSIISKEEHSQWINNLRGSLKNKFWVVFWGEVPIGAAYFQNIDSKQKQSEWGFYIGDSSFRGLGLSKCILFSFLTKAFEERKLNLLITKVLATNARAIHLYNSFSFTKTTQLSNEDGAQILLFELREKEWEKVREKLQTMCRTIKERVEKDGRK